MPTPQSDARRNPFVCGCGNPARYFSNGIGSCNRYSRCPSYFDLLKVAQESVKAFDLCEQALLDIEEYFQCQYESEIDGERVDQIISNLTNKLKEVNQ